MSCLLFVKTEKCEKRASTHLMYTGNEQSHPNNVLVLTGNAESDVDYEYSVSIQFIEIYLRLNCLMDKL